PDPLTEVSVGLECRSGTTCAATPVQTIAVTRNIQVVLTDPAPPTVTVPSPPPTTPLRGTVPITFEGRDQGSGVSGGLLVVDGTDQPFFPDPDHNGGKCVEPIVVLVPCAPRLMETIPLDTTLLPDGPNHHVKVAIFDAANNRT